MLKVGAAQVTANLGLDYRITRGVNVDLDIDTLMDCTLIMILTVPTFLSEDNLGALKLPSYGLADLGLTTRFDLFGNNATFRVNCNNLLNTTYIAESNTNIHTDENTEYTWNGVDSRNFVWFGFGRT